MIVDAGNLDTVGRGVCCVSVVDSLVSTVLFSFMARVSCRCQLTWILRSAEGLSWGCEVVCLVVDFVCCVS